MKKLILPFWITLSAIFLSSMIWMGVSTFYTRMPEPYTQGEFYSTETLDDLQRIHIKAIEEARKSVLLIIYALNDRQIIQALKKKAALGIDVQVICDIEASAKAPKKLGKNVKVTLRKAKNIMHQKILTIDDQKIWIGSANMTTTSLKLYGNLVTGFDSPPLAQWIRKKFNEMKKGTLNTKTPVKKFSIGGQNIEIWFFPDSPTGAEKIRNLIQTAQKSIRVGMYTWTRFDFAQDIIDAQHRGIKTEIVLDNGASKNASQKIAKHLFKSGIPIRVNQARELLHHKFMIIDEKMLINGSANWTYQAFSNNDDCFVIVHELNQKQSAFLNNMWKQILRDSRLYEFVPSSNMPEAA